MFIFQQYRVSVLRFLWTLPLTLAVCIHAQMVSPKIDDEPGPFSYFSQSTDELGVPGARSGAEITPQGYLYTGFGELMFFTGPDQTPVEARVRTLESGHLPVFSYTVSRMGIDYHFSIFAAAVGKSAQCVLFARVTAANPGDTPARCIPRRRRALPGRADHRDAHRRQPLSQTHPQRRHRAVLPARRGLPLRLDLQPKGRCLSARWASDLSLSRGRSSPGYR